ncbi:uncharacterized protein METZ01_LOCUS447074, partial [marine metagenome]
MDKKVYALRGSSGPADSPWPMRGQNAQRTRRKGAGSLYASYALVAGAGDTDNAAFTIAGNELKLTAPADFEAKETYSLRVEGTDPGGLTFTKALTVTVTDVSDPPVITSNGGGATASVSVLENQVAVTMVVATDPDGDALTYGFVGGSDQAKFTINAATGLLAFAAPPDFENPTDADADNAYVVEVTVTDDGTGNLTDVQTITVTVTDANDAPTDLALDNASIAENGAA